jgi:hypothetical protein
VKMRWKADLPKMPRLPKVTVDAADPAPGTLGPPPAPSAYRANNPFEAQPAEYKAPSMLIEHRRLALLFLAAMVGFALYCWRTPHRMSALDAPRAREFAAPTAPSAAGQGHDSSPAASSTQAPIYIEAIPDKNH